METVRGGGSGFFTGDRPVPLSPPPGKTVLKITLDNPRRTAYDLDFLGRDTDFVVRGECYFDGPSIVYVTLAYPEGSVTEKFPDITLRLVPREKGYMRPENITLPLECAVRLVTFSYAGMYASPNTVKKMILCFDADIEGFSTDNITFAGNAATPVPVPGPLKPVAPGVYEFEAEGITGKPPDVEVNPPDGYKVIPQSLLVTAGQDGPVRFLGAAPYNDVSGAVTGLFLYFDQNIADLSSNDITIDGPATVVPKTLRNDFGMVGIYRVGLNAAAIGRVTVRVDKSGVTVDPSSQDVDVSRIPVTFARLETDGTAFAVTTTRLTLVFDKPVEGLSESDITLDTGTTGATKGPLSGSGTTYTLGISGITAAGEIAVDVQKSGYVISPATVQVHYNSLLALPDAPGIKAKFGVTATGTPGVAAAFNALHEFIQVGGLASGKIKTGDWIDLEGGLEVSAYGAGGGGFNLSAADAVKPADANNAARGTWGRLIVVGVNSFNNINGNNTPHVVFQFQNVPVTHRMTDVNTNEGGYEKSEMRKYLVPVTSVNASGNFLAGLNTAGVPDEVLWAPARALSKGRNGTSYATVNDKLWLPTEREMFGSGTHSADGETAANQARLEYYTDNEHRIKYIDTGATAYWESSSYSSTTATRNFCTVSASGSASNDLVSSKLGIAPAFCVK